MKKIGIIGGTFNPIHMGHLMLAQWAMDEVSLDEVWVVPSGISYMKSGQNVLPGLERLKMVDLAIADNSRFKSSDIEIRREGYTFSYETFEQLKEQYPEDTFFFIVGADCLFSIEKWKFPEKIFSCCTLIAAVRADADICEMEAKAEELRERYRANIMLLNFMNLSISSTEIRSRVSRQKSIRYMVPEKVRIYIEEKGFYQDNE